LDEENDTVWVTEQQLTELFGKARRTIGEHIRNIYKEGELDQKSTWRNFRQVSFLLYFSRRSKWEKYADKVQGTYLILTFTQGELGWKFK
jgi:hypothetical protein